jgi:hypothetical protein
MSDRKSTIGSYEVGYQRPPRSTQFQKGRSGNPAGRPKATKANATDLAAILNDPIPVSAGGIPRKLTAFEIGLRKLARAAIKGGNLRAALALLRLCEKYGINEPGPVPERGGVVIIPNNWDHDEFLAMLLRYGRPPWPGPRSGLPGDPPVKN